MYQPTDLTEAERLIVWRRRQQKTGGRHWTLQEAARHFGTWKNRYQDMEHGRHEAPHVEIEGLTERECLFVARRRLGETINGLARLQGVSRVTVLARESGRTATRGGVEWFNSRGWPGAEFCR